MFIYQYITTIIYNLFCNSNKVIIIKNKRISYFCNSILYPNGRNDNYKRFFNSTMC